MCTAAAVSRAWPSAGVILDATHEALAYELETSWLEGSEDSSAAHHDTMWASRQITMDNKQRNGVTGSHKLGVFWGLLDMLKVRNRSNATFGTHTQYPATQTPMIEAKSGSTQLNARMQHVHIESATHCFKQNCLIS